MEKQKVTLLMIYDAFYDSARSEYFEKVDDKALLIEEIQSYASDVLNCWITEQQAEMIISAREDYIKAVENTGMGSFYYDVSVKLPLRELYAKN